MRLNLPRWRLAIVTVPSTNCCVSQDQPPDRAAQENRDDFIGVSEAVDKVPQSGSGIDRRIVMVFGLVVSTAVGALMIADVNAPPAADSAPRVIASSPSDGSTIAPGPFTLSVTFDRPMRRDSFSFATGPEGRFPKCQARPFASRDGRTFSLRCTARPGESYVVWANHGRFMNFRSDAGLAARPSRLAFAVAPAS